MRSALRTCSELFTIANRTDLPESERLTAARLLCSSQYLAKHPLAFAAEGGIVGVPRNLSKNFQAWREGPNIWICTSNRVGPVYQFVFQDGVWRFDGLVAILRPTARSFGRPTFPSQSPNQGSFSKYALLSEPATASCVPSGLKASPYVMVLGATR